MMDTNRIARLLAEGRLTQAQVEQAAVLGIVPAALAPGVDVTAQQTNLASFRTKATAALTANSAFLAIASPTNAQIAAQVKLLTREVGALIRLTLRELDSTDGT